MTSIRTRLAAWLRHVADRIQPEHTAAPLADADAFAAQREQAQRIARDE